MDNKRAREAYLRALQTLSTNLDVNFAMANTCLKLKDYPTAIQYFKVVVQLDKTVKSDKFLKAFESLGDIYNLINDMVRAEKVFKKILQYYPENEFALKSL